MPTDEPLVESELAEDGPQRRGGPWKLIIVVALLTLIGVWLVPGDAPEDTPVPVEVPDTAPPSLLGEDDSTAPQAPPTIEDTEAVDDSPGARARALIARLRAEGAVDLTAVYDAARAAQAEGQLADAYLLYFFAAREGHALSALALGTQADPGSRNPQDSVFADANLTQAHKWYQIAADAGNAEAGDRLADLRQRVERRAAEGDRQAQRLSLLWQ